MTQTRELSPLVLPHHYLDSKLGTNNNIYTVTFSVNLGFMAGLADTYLGRSILRVVSVVVATGGFVTSLAVIILAPFFPSLVSAAPPQIPYPPIAATSSPPRRRRTYAPPVSITVSVRRDPSIVPIIERSERDSASPGPAPPGRRVSFSPQSSSTSVPTIPNGYLVDPPSRPGSSNGHPAPAMRRVLEQETELSAYVLPTPPASIASISSEGDERGMEDFGIVNPTVGKQQRRSLLFSSRRGGSVRNKEKPTAENGELFGFRRRAQSVGIAVAEEASKRSSWISHSSHESSAYDDTVRESETETDRVSHPGTADKAEKESRRRSGLSFQDFKTAFAKRERRASVLISTSGSYTLSPSEASSSPRTSLGLGKPSSVSPYPSPRSASDELARKKRASSPPLRLDTANTPHETERREVQSPITDGEGHTRPLFSGEVVIRNESGRRRTRSSAIPGLYADAEVVRRW
ncbi:hypothetical protein AG1IA_06561 [Rhizoctonia solani AG-1 IA]|uniref:Uncharacterized protein n=2 Tax=Rhizoctonia solani TaxID=456999 RepID=A0A8H3A7M8_9AGAM|nr:uncharacterized protein RhiXN_09879 [Rhizoctonia solani]ELU39424.1 hypothetical protein AG1IA_06561 [Rhizoctonia solani AG-1 IA]QRW22292.1 hypothetical protein RhiXN_09879 [Rhizoctonia solani]CAE6404862.1 unnamed protein product [Rhizoctonia solani]